VDVCQLLKTKNNQGNDTPTRINLTTDANELQVWQLGEDARTLAATTLETFDCSVDPDRVCNYSHNGHDVSVPFSSPNLHSAAAGAFQKAASKVLQSNTSPAQITSANTRLRGLTSTPEIFYKRK
jgi:hypothetical protein